MPRTLPTTSWDRDRFNFSIIDVSGDTLLDFAGDEIYGISSDNSITTTWS